MHAGNVGIYSEGNGGAKRMSVTIGCFGFERVSTRRNPRDAEGTARGIKTRIIGEGNSRGIA